jgi:hypothetical protein
MSSLFVQSKNYYLYVRASQIVVVQNFNCTLTPPTTQVRSTVIEFDRNRTTFNIIYNDKI